MRQPDETGGLGTQSIYLVVTDVDAVHARAVAAGAVIVLALKDEDYGGRGFTCRDPEGHLWSIGSYDPRA
ncbi:Glyoxalase-like domain protein [compost metagenome]